MNLNEITDKVADAHALDWHIEGWECACGWCPDRDRTVRIEHRRHLATLAGFAAVEAVRPTVRASECETLADNFTSTLSDLETDPTRRVTLEALSTALRKRAQYIRAGEVLTR